MESLERKFWQIITIKNAFFVSMRKAFFVTDTAKLIGSWSNGLSSSDFHYCTEDIYQKKNGEYFLHGSGGAMSIYGKSYGGGMCWGDDIIPVTEKEVKVWAEAYLTAEEYMELYEVTE